MFFTWKIGGDAFSHPVHPLAMPLIFSHFYVCTLQKRAISTKKLMRRKAGGISKPNCRMWIRLCE